MFSTRNTLFIKIQNLFLICIVAWSSDGIMEQQKLLAIGALSGGYGTDISEEIKHVLSKYMNVENKHFLVIGSQLPWIETILISLNIKKITTLEYNDYKTDHSKISIISPSRFREMVQSKKAPMFDGMVTFSSIEHSGLGRYKIIHLNISFLMFKIRNDYPAILAL